MNQQIFKNMALWVVVLLTVILLLAVVNKGEEPPAEKTYSQLIQMLRDGQVKDLLIEDGHVTGETGDAQGKFHAYLDEGFRERFAAEIDAARERDPNLSIDMRPKAETPMLQQMLFAWGLPLLLIVGFWVFMARQMQAGGGKAMSFGKSRARGCLPRARRA